jgi:hypothetical protein
MQKLIQAGVPLTPEVWDCRLREVRVFLDGYVGVWLHDTPRTMRGSAYMPQNPYD